MNTPVKPAPLRKAAVTWSSKYIQTIYLYATPDAAEEFSAFGGISPAHNPNQYRLEVDTRFGFDKVVAYIESYGQSLRRIG